MPLVLQKGCGKLVQPVHPAYLHPVIAAIRLHHDLTHLKKTDADADVQTLLAMGVLLGIAGASFG